MSIYHDARSLTTRWLPCFLDDRVRNLHQLLVHYELMRFLVTSALCVCCMKSQTSLQWTGFQIFWRNCVTKVHKSLAILILPSDCRQRSKKDWCPKLLVWNSLRRQIYVSNLVDNTNNNYSVILSHRRNTTVSLETYPLYSLTISDPLIMLLECNLGCSWLNHYSQSEEREISYRASEDTI